MLRLDTGDADIERAERHHPPEANGLQQFQLIVFVLKVAVADLAGLSSAAALNALRSSFALSKKLSDTLSACNLYAAFADVGRRTSSAAPPAMHSYREHVQMGGLISYGVDVPQNFHRATYFVDRTLKGAKPRDLPIQNAS